MPAQPLYIHRLNDALGYFERFRAPAVDRRAVEEAFAVSATTAWRIMRKVGAEPGPGNTQVCDRGRMVEAIVRWRDSKQVDREFARREKVEGRLQQLLQSAIVQHLEIAPPAEGVALVSSRFQGLPDGVTLGRDRLTIDFAGLQDFLRKFGAVLFAVQNDLEEVRTFVGDSP